MGILIMGMGYVGVTTAVMLAELGWEVTGYDPVSEKIDLLSQGKLPIYEPGLEPRLRHHLDTGAIRFSRDPGSGIRNNRIAFLCVGTPASADGSANTEYIRIASETIGEHMQEHKLIVVKSTVPVDTHGKIEEWVASAQRLPIPFDVVMNPEFLREGSALEDSLHPDRIVIGSDDDRAASQVAALYESVSSPLIVTTPKTAVMIKYASNAFLATKISFINELSRLCEAIGVNVADVAEGMGHDRRIGKLFLKAGIGYGGSCFPKDVDALLSMGSARRVPLSIIKKAAEVNRTQPGYVLDVWERQAGSFAGKTVALLGIAFKPDTDDLREAPGLVILSRLLGKKAKVRVHDPLAKLPDSFRAEGASQVETIEQALAKADAAIVCTEWPEYEKADWRALKGRMRGKALFDGRNLFDGAAIRSSGLDYYGVGNYRAIRRKR